jgi:arylsulfatase A-like enzyme
MSKQFHLTIHFSLPVLLTGMLSVSSMAQDRSKPNVIFIYGDDVGYGDLECYGAQAVKTPNVNRLANEGLRFTQAYSCASTSTPSRYGLLTGHYPWRRDDTGIARGDAPMIIHKDQYTVADLMKDAGYVTAAVGKWHLGLGEGGYNCQNWNGYITPGLKDLGFDYSYIMAATGDRVPCVFIENGRVVNLDPKDPIEVSYTTPFEGEPTGKTHPWLLKMLPSHGHDQAIVNGISRIGYMRGGKSALWVDENIADTITTKAVRFIEKNKERPFFLYFGTQDIHVPRVPHPRFVGKTNMGPRGDVIVEFDWSVGQILETLDRLGLTNNTLIILTSDNGPVVDDGYKDQAVEKLGDHKPWGMFRGGKYSIYEAGTRMPFIICWPGKVKQGVSNAMISQIDLFGVLSQLTKQPIPEKAAPDTHLELSTWLGKSHKDRDYVIQQSLGTLAIVQHNWKYIVPSEGPKMNTDVNIELGNDTAPQLYNLAKDIGEKINLAPKYPEKVIELSKLLKAVKRDGKDLAVTPPMGWNSWNWFGKKEINEEIIKECMDAVIKEGLRDAGYRYFVVDGGWRDVKLGPKGELLSHPQKFPHGMKVLADYAHSLGLKFGLHTVPGTHDCGKDPVGGYGHEEVQIKQFVDWGVDFIKLDKCRFDVSVLRGITDDSCNCHTFDKQGWDETILRKTYEKWHNLLNNCGRDIVLSISAYTWRDWYPEVGQMGRTTGDIRARVTGGAVFDSLPLSVMAIADENNKYADFAGYGYWNDPDMMVTGNHGLTLEEQKVHFALWCIMSSPLILGNDPRAISPEEKAIILNKKAIAVNQDPTEQGRRIKKNGPIEIWAKKLRGEQTAVLLLNRDDKISRNVVLNLEDIGITQKVKAWDIYGDQLLGSFSGSITKKISPQSGLFLLLKF